MNVNRVARRYMQKQARSNESRLQSLLGMLHAIYWNHWTSHWQSKGNAAYGDHLLFERLYEAVKDEIDGLAEKLVAWFGNNAVNPLVIQSYSLAYLKRLHEVSQEEDPNPVATALSLERLLQEALEDVYAELDEEGDMSLGMDNFLQGIADTHETHIYLLQQRSKFDRGA